MERQRTSIIKGYERALEISDQMLAHAEAMEWQALIEYENLYLKEIDTLRTLDAQVSLDQWRREHKKSLLDRLMKNDQRLSELLQKRLAELGGLLNESRNRRKIGHAYGAVSKMKGAGP